MAEANNSDFLILITIFVGLGVIILVFLLKWIKQEQSNKDNTKNDKSAKSKSSSTETSGKHGKKEQQAAKPKKKQLTERETRRTARANEKGFNHPWLLATLKGHTGRVLDMDFSANGKYLVSCGDDRTVFIWGAKELANKDRKSLRVNIEFDYATHVKWSPDCKAFIIHRFNENCLEVYKVDKKKDGWLTASKAVTFPKGHDTDVIGMGIASNGKFIMTCSNKTDMIVWDLKGEKLAKLDTFLMSTECAKISPCGRFIVASGFTPEAKTWEVVFDKSGDFKEAKQVPQLNLGGHSSGVYDVAFDVDSSHMATVSKDLTWRLFDTKVNYKQGQDARLDISGRYESSSSKSLVALSPNAEVLVVATANDLQFYSTMTGKLDSTVENISNEHITSILFDASGKHLLVSSDKQIRVFLNVPGYRCAIAHAKEKLKEHQTSATRERLQQLVKESEDFLKNF
ncbi:unnamed protein product [Ceutorhynchus assimilis]|uniref:Transducin beta-like protein 2 n=1 Tax=Ceutorhynchus assimilis TaxID=467358 RepID=A0A9N9MMI6_9CUCU|nr:unnamed protein product [Ceutorhynchus assimilis]